MNDQTDLMAGWLAIVAGVLLVPEAILFLGVDAGQTEGAVVLVSASLILALRIVFTSFALWRFRALLRRSIDFHGLDTLVPAMILSSVLLGAAVIVTRTPAAADATPFNWISLLATGVVAGLLSAAIGWRLLKLDWDAGGLSKSYAWTCILAPLCFASVVALPIGLLLLAASSILLGLILMRGTVRLPDFV